MGKRLVIKGADFSKNAIVQKKEEFYWYITEYTDNIDKLVGSANLVNGGWGYLDNNNGKIQGKTINCIRFIPSAEGVLNLYKMVIGSTTTELIATTTILPSEVGSEKIVFFVSTFIAVNERFVFGNPNSEVGMKYGPAIDAGGFYSKLPQTPTQADNYTLGVDVGWFGIIE